MNFEMACKILQLAVTLLQSHSRSTVNSQADILDTLVQIMSQAQAYHDHLGKPLDVAAVVAEPPLANFAGSSG